MQIKLTTSLAGHGFAHHTGEVLDKPDTEAQRLVTAGFAVPAADSGGGLEQAINPEAQPTETRQVKPRRPRKPKAKDGD